MLKKQEKKIKKTIFGNYALIFQILKNYFAAFY